MKNRYGDEYNFEIIDDKTMTITGELDHWRFGGREGQQHLDSEAKIKEGIELTNFERRKNVSAYLKKSAIKNTFVTLLDLMTRMIKYHEFAHLKVPTIIPKTDSFFSHEEFLALNREIKICPIFAQ